MTPVYQTRFDEEGNCVAACYATLLGLPLDAIPEMSDEPQWDAEVVFLASLGLAPVKTYPLDMAKNSEDPIEAMSWSLHHLWLPDGVFYLVSGRSPRGYEHRVLAIDEMLLHDPHPEGGGVIKLSAVTFLVPLLPGGYR